MGYVRAPIEQNLAGCGRNASTISNTRKVSPTPSPVLNIEILTRAVYLSSQYLSSNEEYLRHDSTPEKYH